MGELSEISRKFIFRNTYKQRYTEAHLRPVKHV